jgi:hypothetical protein
MTRLAARLIVAFIFMAGLAWPLVGHAEVVDSETLLVPGDAHFNQHFGYSVAVGGNTAVIGAPEDALLTGSANVYNKVGSNWVQLQKIIPPQAGSNDLVGISVAMENDLLAIGAPGFNPGLTNSVGLNGTVYVYQRGTNGFWTEQARITAPDAQRNDRFGVSIAMNGQSLVIGSSFHSDFGATNNGSIYVFDFTAVGWQLAAKITPNDLTNNSNFGERVAISGDTIIAGAASSILSTGLVFNVLAPGAAYVYSRSTVDPFFRPWTFQQKLVPTNAAVADQFGFSVAVNNDTALVGAPFSASGGSVYAYTRTATNWTEQAQLVSSNSAAGDNFGFSVSFLGNRALIGAPGKTSDRVSGLGAAYIFEQADTAWFEQQELLPLQTAKNFQFGFSTAIDPAALIVGASSASIGRGTGAAYAFSSSQSIVSIISATANPSVLIAPDRVLVPVTITVETTGTNVTSRIIDVTSNQSPVGRGPSADAPDWVITGDLTLLLRAEGNDNIDIDRIYNVVVQSTDSFGNLATTTVPVIVPHTLGGIATVPPAP